MCGIWTSILLWTCSQNNCSVFTISYCNFQTMVNTVYCILILMGKLIQAIIFGELRVSEQQVSTDGIGCREFGDEF